jgi:hypothetical protein
MAKKSKKLQKKCEKEDKVEKKLAKKFKKRRIMIPKIATAKRKYERLT